MNGPVLRGIQLPSASWWPPAPGWWIVLAIVLACAAIVAYAIRHHRRGGVLRSVLAEIDQLQRQYALDGDANQLADRASRLMRRVARHVDAAAAATSGAAWQAFVTRYASGDSGRTLQAFAESRYRAQPAIDADALLVALRGWCRHALGRRVARGVRAA